MYSECATNRRQWHREGSGINRGGIFIPIASPLRSRVRLICAVPSRIAEKSDESANYEEKARGGRGIVSRLLCFPRETPHKSDEADCRASLYPEARCRQNLDLRPGIDRGSESVNQSAEFLPPPPPHSSCRFATKHATRS